MPITGALVGNITMTDNLAGSVQLVKALNFQYTGTIMEYSQNQLVGTTPTTLNIPLSPNQFLYIKNLATGTNLSTVTVTWTPNGASSNVVFTIQPGSTLLFVETNTLSGITALSVTASAINTPIEYILLG